MLIAIAFDITDDRRRYRVNQVLLRFGYRVQKSVFEAHLTDKQLEVVKKNLLREIDLDCDSVRYYNLGEVWRERVNVQGLSEITPLLEFIVI